MENLHIFEGRSERVSNLLYPGTKIWDDKKVHELFRAEDAEAILKIQVSQRMVGDRVAWYRSIDGKYNVKSDTNFGMINIGPIMQLFNLVVGRNKIGKLFIPHKMKIFI